MRSSQNAIRSMISEVRKGIGAKTNQEAWEHVSKAKAYFVKRLEPLGFTCITLSPYRGNMWQLSAMGSNKGDGVPWVSLNLNFEDWADMPHRTVTAFIAKFGRFV